MHENTAGKTCTTNLILRNNRYVIDQVIVAGLSCSSALIEKQTAAFLRLSLIILVEISLLLVKCHDRCGQFGIASCCLQRNAPIRYAAIPRGTRLFAL